MEQDYLRCELNAPQLDFENVAAASSDFHHVEEDDDSDVTFVDKDVGGRRRRRTFLLPTKSKSNAARKSAENKNIRSERAHHSSSSSSSLTDDLRNKLIGISRQKSYLTADKKSAELFNGSFDRKPGNGFHYRRRKRTYSSKKLVFLPFSAGEVIVENRITRTNLRREKFLESLFFRSCNFRIAYESQIRESDTLLRFTGAHLHDFYFVPTLELGSRIEFITLSYPVFPRWRSVFSGKNFPLPFSLGEERRVEAGDKNETCHLAPCFQSNDDDWANNGRSEHSWHVTGEAELV